MIKTFQIKSEVPFQVDFNKLRLGFLQNLSSSWEQTQQHEHLREQQENELLNEESGILKNLGEDQKDGLGHSSEEGSREERYSDLREGEKKSFKYIKQETPDTEDSIVSSIQGSFVLHNKEWNEEQMGTNFIDGTEDSSEMTGRKSHKDIFQPMTMEIGEKDDSLIKVFQAFRKKKEEL